MKIKLLQTCHIPDETWKKTKECLVQPVATNYAGATLEVGDELGQSLIDERKAELVAEAATAKPSAPRSALESRIASTVDGPSSEK